MKNWHVSVDVLLSSGQTQTTFMKSLMRNIHIYIVQFYRNVSAAFLVPTVAT